MSASRASIATSGALLLMMLYADSDDRSVQRPSLQRDPLLELRHQELSGMTHDEEGRLWAVSEVRRELVRFDSGDLLARRVFPLIGVAQNLELESVAWLGEHWLAFGTEIDAPRDSDVILLARVSDDHAVILDASSISWKILFGETAPPNKGIEGLCATGGTIIAAAEWIVRSGTKRRAPLVRARHDRGRVGDWEPMLVELSSEDGKVSALDCMKTPHGSIAVYAIERHFGVSRLLRFEITDMHALAPVVPEMVLDLAANWPDVPNLEGFSVVGDRSIFISDHDEDDPVGTTELLHVGLNLNGS